MLMFMGVDVIWVKRLLSQTIQPTNLEKRDCLPTSPLAPGIKFYYLQCSGVAQSKTGVNLVEVSKRG